MHSDVAIIIPSRIGSQRLFEKPLQPIGEFSMIEHVLRQTQLTDLKHIYVTTDSKAIAEKVAQQNGQFIYTDENCPSGTDRVFQAFQKISDNHNINYILNVQGDMPFVEPEVILNVIESLKKSDYGIMTPVTKVEIEVADSASNVKVITDHQGKALYFSRSLIPHGASEFLYHVGIYGFRKEALIKFMELPISSLEKSEKLEQLRALQNGISIGVCYVDNVPISIDTQEDLDKALAFYSSQLMA